MSSEIFTEFKKVDVQDHILIQSYLDRCHYHESNHNFINMLIWLDEYVVYEYHDDDMMLLVGKIEEEYYLYMPLCHEVYFIDAIKKAMFFFDKYHKPLHITCVDTRHYHIIADHFEIVACEKMQDSFDYIYDLERLVGFKGKKLQKKRNHLNQFYKIYADRFNYESLDETNIDDLLRYVQKLSSDTRSKAIEKSGIIRVLKDYRHLPCKVGIMKIDGVIEAFCIASRLSDVMIQENVEKANKDIRGLSQAMINEFFKREFTDGRYLNREDDMGLENLRKSKMSYCPIDFIEKYYISL